MGEKDVRVSPDFGNPPPSFASSALGGRMEEAEKIVQQLLQLNPTLTISDLKDVYPFADMAI